MFDPESKQAEQAAAQIFSDASERRYGIPTMATTAKERDLAVIARRKGNEARHIAAIAGTTEWARLYPRPDPNDGRLPESAFDWPVYVAATTLRCVPMGDGTLGPSEDVSRAVKDHLSTLAHEYPLETDEWLAERG